MSARLAREKAALERTRAIKRAALEVFVTIERTIRDEVGRFRSAQDRARRRLQAEASAQLARQRPTRRLHAVFTPDEDDEAIAAPLTLAPLPRDGAGWRRWWHVTLVDPTRPRDRDGDPVENVEAGIKALAAAVTNGTAPWELLQLNADEAQLRVDEAQDTLDLPGLVPSSTLRPIITDDGDAP